MINAARTDDHAKLMLQIIGLFMHQFSDAYHFVRGFIISFQIHCLMISLTKDLQCERKKVQAQKHQNAKGKAVQAELRNARNTIAKLKKKHKMDMRKMMLSQHYQQTRKALYSVVKTFIFHRIRLAFKTWQSHTRVCKRTIMCIKVGALTIHLYMHTKM